MQRENGLETWRLPFRKAWINNADYFGDSEPDGSEGGDFFDFLSLSASELGAVIGSVRGAGAEAAVWKARLQYGVRGLAGRAMRPATIVSELNRMMWETSLNEIYAGIFLAQLDPTRRQLTYANAGHEAALLIRADTGQIRRLERTGTVLGLSHRATFGQHSIPVSQGDTLIAYTDGIADAVDGEGRLFTEHRLREIAGDCPAAAPRQAVGAILDGAEEFTGGMRAGDRTVIAVRITEVPGGGMFLEARNGLALVESV
ncbi:MAG: serine/threonine-protein phosphatase [Bryobacterales bacterium]|nr:serine/threonine-protein phosphatase [Bryobacterales bacterium]